MSIGVFFSLITAGLAAALPTTLSNGLTRVGIPAVVAGKIAHLPPTSALFAAFLGYNPMATLVPANELQALPAARRATLLGHSFFPNLISPPFMLGLHSVFYLSAAMCLVAALASLLRGKHHATPREAMRGSEDNARSPVPATSDADEENKRSLQ